MFQLGRCFASIWIVSGCGFVDSVDFVDWVGLV